MNPFTDPVEDVMEAKFAKIRKIRDENDAKWPNFVMWREWFRRAAGAEELNEFLDDTVLYHGHLTLRRARLLAAAWCRAVGPTTVPLLPGTIEEVERRVDENSFVEPPVEIPVSLLHPDSPDRVVGEFHLYRNLVEFTGRRLEFAWRLTGIANYARYLAREGQPARRRAALESSAQSRMAVTFALMIPNYTVFKAEWRTDTAIAIATQMYASREFSAAPILADALQDAGCDDGEMLSLLRFVRPGSMFRGFWPVDQVLGHPD